MDPAVMYNTSFTEPKSRGKVDVINMNPVDPRFIKFRTKTLPFFFTKLFIKAVNIDRFCILTSIIRSIPHPSPSRYLRPADTSSFVIRPFLVDSA